MSRSLFRRTPTPTLEPFEVIYEQGKRGRWRFTIRVAGKALAVSAVRGFLTLERATEVVNDLFHTSEREFVTTVVEYVAPQVDAP